MQTVHVCMTNVPSIMATMSEKIMVQSVPITKITEQSTFSHGEATVAQPVQ
jgi:hypothetical protein